eukprot:scaffold70882_cov17-Tisochrysis_lutea.AAC.1
MSMMWTADPSDASECFSSRAERSLKPWLVKLGSVLSSSSESLAFSLADRLVCACFLLTLHGAAART